MSNYVHLYSGATVQHGEGISDIEIYRGPIYRQRGAGLGTFLLSTFRQLRPLIASGMNALADQGVRSASSVLSQLGKKNLQQILDEEKSLAFDNLKDKAIKKLNQMSGKVGKNQSGSGILFGKITKSKKKNTLKTKTAKKKKQSATSSKIGRSSSAILNSPQIGKGKSKKAKKSKKSQIGKGKVKKNQKGKGKAKKIKCKSNKTKRILDILN